MTHVTRRTPPPTPAGRHLTFLVAAAFALLLPFSAPLANGAVDFAPVAGPEEVGSGSLLIEHEGGGYDAAPTLDTAVEMTITGMVARVSVVQAFTNPGTEWVNGIYVFPLPDTAAVDRLRMQIGERVIEGQIAERAAARRTYEKAREAGKKASLVEQQRPNIFTNSVANIGPGETVKVTIEYQETIAYDKGRFSIRFPMTVGIRYIPGTASVGGFDGGGWAFNTDAVPDASSITPPVTDADEGYDNPVSIVVTLNTGFPLVALDSRYHAVKSEKLARNRYRVELAGGVVPADRDFELTWTPEPHHAPRAALFTQELEDERYGLLMMVPPETEWAARTALPREMIYVIDTSGSMHGTSIAQAREALRLGLGRLGPQDAFNIVEFNSAPRMFTPQAIPANAANLARADAWVRNLRANGGTEMAAALRTVLNGSDDPSRVRQVIFLTDGSVGNEQALFGIIHQRLGDSRLFTVGIGSAPNTFFMREAATAGRGTFTHIGDVGEVREKMTDLFGKLEFPVLANVEIDWADGTDVDYWPNPIRDLYVHEPLVVSFRLGSDVGTLQVRGMLNGSGWSTELEAANGAAASGLDVLWARNKIRSLEQQRARGTPADDIRTAITELGLKHHIVTRHTSLVAVDVTPSRPAEADAENAAVPSKKPHGWQMNSPGTRLPQTATPAALHLLIALCAALGSALTGFGRRRERGE